MKILAFLVLLFSAQLMSQQNIRFDSLQLRGVSDFFADDYGNLYLYKNQDFSFTKYDPKAKQLGKVMLTVPFRVQSVQNPLNIFLFSENNQELKMLDANLNEIQRVDFRTQFGFVKAAYTEDLQQVWLLDESSKRLVQYNYRNNIEINSFPLNINFDVLKGILVFDKKLYTISEDRFTVYDFKGNLLFDQQMDHPKKLYRENEDVYIICEKEIFRYRNSQTIENVFFKKDAKIVDKNSSSYFELKGGKFYLYKIEK